MFSPIKRVFHPNVPGNYGFEYKKWVISASHRWFWIIIMIHDLVVLQESEVKRLEPRHKKRIQLLATGGLGCAQINKWSVYHFLSQSQS